MAWPPPPTRPRACSAWSPTAGTSPDPALDLVGAVAAAVALQHLPLFIVESCIAASIAVTAVIAVPVLGIQLHRDGARSAHQPLFRVARIQGLRRAAAYYARRFGVKLDPETRSSRRSAPRKASPISRKRSPRPATSVLVPNPAYPIHAFGFIMAGGVYPSHPGPRRRRISPARHAVRHSVADAARARAELPANPTAQVAGLDFYKEVVAFAKKHEI